MKATEGCLLIDCPASSLPGTHQGYRTALLPSQYRGHPEGGALERGLRRVARNSPLDEFHVQCPPESQNKRIFALMVFRSAQ